MTSCLCGERPQPGAAGIPGRGQDLARRAAGGRAGGALAHAGAGGDGP